tara:strand:+ start:466 stop:1218 length:753 start_codon:yes stop_codon:yes gene_type:complete
MKDFQAFSHWFTISTNLFLIIGVICYIKLPKIMRSDIHYWLPFLILAFSVFYENLGAYTNYNSEFKRSVNTYLGNIEYPKFNLWVHNITERQIAVIFYLLLIRLWLITSRKKYIDWMICIFIVSALILQFSGIEPLYLNQPIIFSIGANMILIGTGLYFIGIITEDEYLACNPLRLPSFWQMTFIMFTFTLTYISSVALMYLYQVNPMLGSTLQDIGLVMQFLTLIILTLSIASPLLPRIFEQEPSYEFS